MEVKYPEVTVELIGEDGNAFAVMGAVSKALAKHLRNEGADRVQIDKALKEYKDEAMSGDYDNLLQVSMRWVNVE